MSRYDELDVGVLDVILYHCGQFLLEDDVKRVFWFVKKIERILCFDNCSFLDHNERNNLCPSSNLAISDFSQGSMESGSRNLSDKPSEKSSRKPASLYVL